MTNPLVTLTTDFGMGSRYVAAMKGVIYRINPHARLVDLSHSIPAGNIRKGAIFLSETALWYPPGTIHVAVVDPGVGSERRILYAECDNQRFLAPDNGLLSRLARDHSTFTIRHVTERRFWLPEVSATFHGRDIFAPVAAHLSLGLDPKELGPPLTDLKMLKWEDPLVAAGKIKGIVESIDSFGNLITNITEGQLTSTPRGEDTIIICDEHETHGIFRTYADQPEMTLIALVGSGGKLELAIVGDSAKIMLGVSVGTPVEVKW
jgi:S-adenosylmethionine hydrolase